MRQDLNAPPLNPLPMVVWALALPIIAMEVLMQLAERGLVGGAAGIGWRVQALERFVYAPELARALWERGLWAHEGWLRLVTYPVVHGDFTSALFAVVLLLALGKMVGEVFRWWAVLAVFLGSTVLGAVVYTLVLPGEQAPLFGAYVGDYGLIGAFTFLLWVRLAGTGTQQFRAFTLIGALLAVQLLFGLLFGGGYTWVAEVAGFATGFLLSFVVSPGGWRRVLARVRGR